MDGPRGCFTEGGTVSHGDLDFVTTREAAKLSPNKTIVVELTAPRSHQGPPSSGNEAAAHRVNRILERRNLQHEVSSE